MKAAVLLGALTVAAGASMALAGREPGKRVVVDGHQIRFCARGLCAGPERWAQQSRRNFQRARWAEQREWLLTLQVEKLHRRLTLRRLQARQPSPIPPDNSWRAKQIQAAETIARESGGDPWPNCPDPYDGSGASWDDTVGCENGGDWNDSPGYFRCGLQFEPMWERRFGRLCP